MKCKNCGAKLDKHTRFCGACGAEVSKKKKLSKKAQAVIVCVCCLAVIISGTIGGFYLKNKNNVAKTDTEDSNYVMLEEGFTDVKVTDEASALEAISSVSDVIGIDDVNSELEISSTNTIDNNTYYKFQQYYNNIPVYGKSICLVSDSAGTVTALTSNFEQITDLNYKNIDEYNNTVIYINSGKCYLCETEYKSHGYETYLSFIDVKSGKEVNSLCQTFTLNKNDYIVNQNNKYQIFDKNKNLVLLNSNKEVMELEDIKLDNGNIKRVLYSDNNLNNTRDIANGSMYRNDIETKFQYEINNNISFVTSEDINGFDKNAINTIESVEKTYLYYLNELKRNGFDNHNSKMYIVYNDQFYNDPQYVNNYGKNAYSNESVLKFGYELNTESVDIVAHEFTHSVERTISNMNYVGESGAIMEGYSDIFGEIIQSYYNKEDPDWYVSFAGNDRNIKNPQEQNMPKTINDDNFKTTKDEKDSNGKTTNDNGNVHHNSTVISHAAYLMWDGIDGDESKKIDCDTLAKLLYNALFMLSSDADFSQCRNAIELSARIMVKNNQLTDTQYRCVQAAFDEVGIENASYTYNETVKNDFTLSVLNYKNTDDVNYNLKIYKPIQINLDEVNLTPKKILDENSLFGDKELHLDNGTYLFKITDLDNDNAEVKIKVVVNGSNSEASDKLTVYTDFTDSTTIVLNEENTSDNLTMVNFIGMTFDDIVALYGENYEVNFAESSDSQMIVSYLDENVPFSFILDVDSDAVKNETPNSNSTVSEIQCYKPYDKIDITVDSDISPNITFSELKNSKDGIVCTDSAMKVFTYKVNDISVDFEYYDIPNDDTVADFIYISKRDWEPEAEDWSANLLYLYQPIIEQYRETCENEHSEISGLCYCSWYLFDVDGDGTEELIVEDGVGEQDRTHHYYTVKNNEVIELGEYNAWHMGLYEEDGNLFARVVSPSTPTEIYQISITDDKVNEKLIKTTDDPDYPPYSNPITFMDISYDVSDYQ